MPNPFITGQEALCPLRGGLEGLRPAKFPSQIRNTVNEIEFGATVLRQQAHALELAASGLNSSFTLAVSCLFTIRGRVAVTGMGKSGHVARKIAATLASTGTPAYFIHPAEASHGDLGMISPDDAMLAFSNSGNTTELSDVLLYASRYGVPVVGITRNTDSLLGRCAAHVLTQPAVPEADPLDCAPTTSTTVQMAMGDALALALMRRRGCTPDEFHRFHPGGSLGRKLLTVQEIMHTGDAMPLVDKQAPMADVLCAMTGKGFGVAGITDANTLVGIITDGDLRRHMGSDLMSLSAGDVMHPSPVTISQDSLAVAALQRMQENRITSLFITQGQAPVGIMNVHDCLRAGLQ